MVTNTTILAMIDPTIPLLTVNENVHDYSNQMTHPNTIGGELLVVERGFDKDGYDKKTTFIRGGQYDPEREKQAEVMQTLVIQQPKIREDKVEVKILTKGADGVQRYVKPALHVKLENIVKTEENQRSTDDALENSLKTRTVEIIVRGKKSKVIYNMLPNWAWVVKHYPSLPKKFSVDSYLEIANWMRTQNDYSNKDHVMYKWAEAIKRANKHNMDPTLAMTIVDREKVVLTDKYIPILINAKTDKQVPDMVTGRMPPSFKEYQTFEAGMIPELEFPIVRDISELETEQMKQYTDSLQKYIHALMIQDKLARTALLDWENERNPKKKAQDLADAVCFFSALRMVESQCRRAENQFTDIVNFKVVFDMNEVEKAALVVRRDECTRCAIELADAIKILDEHIKNNHGNQFTNAVEKLEKHVIDIDKEAIRKKDPDIAATAQVTKAIQEYVAVFSKEFEKLQNDSEDRIQEVVKNHAESIREHQKRQAEEIAEITKRYETKIANIQKQIEKLQNEVKPQMDEKIKAKEENIKKSIEDLKTKHEKKLNELYNQMDNGLLGARTTEEVSKLHAKIPREKPLPKAPKIAIREPEKKPQPETKPAVEPEKIDETGVTELKNDTSVIPRPTMTRDKKPIPENINGPRCNNRHICGVKYEHNKCECWLNFSQQIEAVMATTCKHPKCGNKNKPHRFNQCPISAPKLEGTIALNEREAPTQQGSKKPGFVPLKFNGVKADQSTSQLYHTVISDNMKYPLASAIEESTPLCVEFENGQTCVQDLPKTVVLRLMKAIPSINSERN